MKKSNSFPNEKTIYLIDGLSLIFRSYHAFKDRPLLNTAGENTNAFTGFFRTLFSIIKQNNPQYLAVVLDSKERTFRYDIYSDYKANRSAPPSDLIPQISWIKETLKAMNISILEKSRYEADDLMASIALKAYSQDFYTYILSPDKDLLQVVNDKIHILKLEKGGSLILDPKDIKENKGIWPSQMRDYLALVGDISDNIPGVKGIGDKTASKLLREHETIEGIYLNIEKIKPKLTQERLKKGKEMALLSYELASLETELEIIESFETIKFTYPSLESEKYFLQHNTHSLIKTLKELSQDALPLFTKNLNNETTQQFFEKSVQKRGSYEAVINIDEAQILLKKSLKAPFVVIDTETSGLNFFTSNLLGISLCYESEKAYYFPIQTQEGYHWDLDQLRNLFNTFFSENPKIIGHNIKFDWHILLANNFIIPKAYADTMIMSWLLDSSSSLKMDYLAEKYLQGYQCIAFKEVVPKGKTFAQVPLEQAVEYAAEDADITLRLFKVLLPLIEQEKPLKDLLFNIEMPLLEVLTEMEHTGILIQPKQLEKVKNLIDEKVLDLEEKIFKEAGKSFNILSSQQTQAILLNLNIAKSKSSSPKSFSTSSLSLKKLDVDNPIVNNIVFYRSYKKLLNSYLNTLPTLADPHTGRIHTSFFQPGTETGRLSSQRPNLQNIPASEDEGKEIRNAFIANKNYKLISADYSQIELVVLAHLSRDPILCESFNNGEDIHNQTAKRLFKIQEVSAEQRRIAKTINFGVLYKMSAYRLASELKIQFKEAKEFIDDYFKTYEKIQTFFDEQISSVQEKGYSETILGHKRYLRGISSLNHIERSEAERAAINSIIQGSAADIVKIAMLKVSKCLKKRNLKTNMLLQVHDELVFETQEDELEVTAQLIKKEMENAFPLLVPLKVNIKVGDSWGYMREL